MTAEEVLQKVIDAGGRIIPDPDHPRLLVPPALKPLVLQHREALRQMLRQGPPPGDAYRQALRRFWTLPPEAPRSAYDQALEEVLRREAALLPQEARAILREEARRFHRETGVCPCCREPGPLCLTPDPDLLDLPMARLTGPLPVWSALLGELIYLVPDEATAQRLLAEGKVAYYPEEVAILLEIQARDPDTWREKVQKIHRIKKEFGGLVTELEAAGGGGG